MVRRLRYHKHTRNTSMGFLVVGSRNSRRKEWGMHSLGTSLCLRPWPQTKESPSLQGKNSSLQRALVSVGLYITVSWWNCGCLSIQFWYKSSHAQITDTSSCGWLECWGLSSIQEQNFLSPAVRKMILRTNASDISWWFLQPFRAATGHRLPSFLNFLTMRSVTTVRQA